MTVQDAANWCNSQVGQALNYDGEYGCQCTDLYNFYYQLITGRNPYADGYGVEGAKDIWDVPTTLFTKVANVMADPTQLPPQGAVIIYDGGLSGSDGFGHVAIVDSADATNVTVWDQNWGGQFVHHQKHMWTGHEIGWMIFNGFTEPVTPEPAPAPVETPAPVPVSEAPAPTDQTSTSAAQADQTVTPEVTPEAVPTPVVTVSEPVVYNTTPVIKKGNTMLQELAKYNKLWIALLGAIVTVINQMYGQNQYIQVAISLLTALGVYHVTNVSQRA